ncbi:unnamed protein product [Orchesella dallaii]|uniref:RRM domain-containing protein n=1 Tax=Orchesella dallaii TaxID=48710 RepID=A0ABP1RVN8_9HEXA
MPRGSECRVYIGNLPQGVGKRDVEDLFDKFGRIVNIDVKNGRGSPFAFVEFEDPRDAEDAVIKRNGYSFDGYRIRVEFPRGGSRGSGGVPRLGVDAAVGGPGIRRPNTYRARGRSEYRVLVTGLPASGSWQDLKDHFREAGEVCFADVKDGTGVVEFVRYDDVKYAVKRLDDSRFRSHEGESAYIRVKEDVSKSRSRSRSVSPPRRRRRSSSSSPVRRRTRSSSRSRSRSRSSSRR